MQIKNELGIVSPNSLYFDVTLVMKISQNYATLV